MRGIHVGAVQLEERHAAVGLDRQAQDNLSLLRRITNNTTFFAPSSGASPSEGLIVSPAPPPPHPAISDSTTVVALQMRIAIEFITQLAPSGVPPKIRTPFRYTAAEQRLNDLRETRVRQIMSSRVALVSWRHCVVRE